MPPRFSFWTIVVDALPTAFRARTQAELLPTLRQLQRTHPTAALRWFARGRYWRSPREAAQRLRGPRAQPRPAGPGRQRRRPV